jgi:excisionase family DNA binding protein
MTLQNETRLTLSVPQALAASGIGRTQFYEEVAAGRLPVVKVGRRTLVMLDDLRDWLCRHRVTRPARPPEASRPDTRNSG